jgi:dTDP-4-amino-4,6-dideoxygalactose transaminase
MSGYAKTLPAYLGGEPVIDATLPVSRRWPMMTDAEERAVLEILRDGNISTHPVIRGLEQDYCRFTGRRRALAHCNGTAALLAAFFAAGLGPGDEVLVPSATFWASALPMLWLGALPVFCESEPALLGPDPEDVEKKITPRTRAIVLVHLWGLPCRVDRLLDIAKKHSLKVIEDASHAHGAAWRGRPAGRFGDLSVFSLQGDKLAPGGEGGVLLCDSDEDFERAACLGDIHRIARLEGPNRRFAATGFGLKTRIAPLSAAIARAQLAALARNNHNREENIHRLSSRLEALGIDTFSPGAETRRVYFEFIVRANPRKTGVPVDALLAALLAEGAQVSAPRYPLLHQQPFFTEGHFKTIARLGDGFPYPDYRKATLPGTEAVNRELLRLPLFLGAGRETVDRYADAFGKIIAHAPKVLAKWEDSSYNGE